MRQRGAQQDRGRGAHGQPPLETGIRGHGRSLSLARLKPAIESLLPPEDPYSARGHGAVSGVVAATSSNHRLVLAEPLPSVLTLGRVLTPEGELISRRLGMLISDLQNKGVSPIEAWQQFRDQKLHVTAWCGVELAYHDREHLTRFRESIGVRVYCIHEVTYRELGGESAPSTWAGLFDPAGAWLDEDELSPWRYRFGEIYTARKRQ